MLHISSLLLVLFLSEERLVAPASYDAASARIAATATNGRSQLIAWKPFDEEAVYVQMIDDTLALRTPQGVLLGRAQSGGGELQIGGIASDGDGYVVLWGDQRRLRASAVTAAGEVSQPRALAEVSGPSAEVLAPRIASNGVDYLVTWIDRTSNSGRLFARRLDRAGAPIGDMFQVTPPSVLVMWNRLASDGSGYLAVIDGNNPAGVPDAFGSFAIPISATPGALRPVGAGYYASALVYDGTSYVLASYRQDVSRRVFFVAPVSGSGEVGTWREVFADPATNELQALASNGNGSILVLNRNGTPVAIRLAPGGTPLDAAPRALPVAPLSPSLAVTSAPDGKYFVLGLQPLAGARIPANLDAEILIQPQPVALAPVQQSQPRVVPVGGGHVVTLHDGTTLLANGAIAATNVRSSVLATDGTRALIAWTDSRTNMHGRYIDAAGQMSAPFPIAQSTGTVLRDAVAVDGGFVVVWERSGRIWRARVGTNEAPRAFNLPTYAGAGTTTTHQQPALVRTAGGFLLVYTELVNSSRSTIRAMAFGNDATEAGPMRTIADTIDYEDFPDVASDGAGRLLVVWSALPLRGGSNEVRAALVAEDGTVIGEERTLAPGTAPRVVWTGTEFVIVRGGDLGVMSRDGEVLQPLAPALGPVQETTVGGRVIAYARDGLVFVRTLGPVRRRATR